MAIKVHEADNRDRAFIILQESLNALPLMELLGADAGYTRKLADDTRTHLGWRMEIVKLPRSGWQGTWAPKDAR